MQLSNRQSRSGIAWIIALVVVALGSFLLGRVVGPAQGNAARVGELANGTGAGGREIKSETEKSAATGKVASWEARWESLNRTIPSKRDWRGLSEALEELARADPRRALKLACAEQNMNLRTRLQLAVLRGWSSHEPESAVDWAMKLPENARTDAVDAVLSGAAGQPESASKLCERLCSTDASRAHEYTQSLLNALAGAGAFEAGVRFVESAPPSPQRLEELNTAFALWATHAPEEAAERVHGLQAPELREEAFRGLAIGWAQADPIGLANYALRLPAGAERAQALASAIPRWLDADAVAAASWIKENGAEPHPDFDSGVIAVATAPTIVERRPELAVSLAEGIADLPLRANTLRTLALKWAEKDVGAARRYVEGSNLFSAEDRGTLLNELNAVPHG